MNQIGFKWLDSEAVGAIELFNVEDLYTETPPKRIMSEFKRANSTEWESSVSILTVTDNVATLNWEPFQEQNEKLDLFPGILKMTLSGDKTKPDITEVEFKDIKSTEFEPVSFEQIQKLNPKFTDDGSDADARVRIAMALSPEARQALLPKNGNIPKKINVSSTVFVRNPVVVAERLIKAKGICGKCGEEAPFKSRTTGMPYLEVHHKIRLADGGSDDLENTIALCPNCHRELHFGGVA